MLASLTQRLWPEWNMDHKEFLALPSGPSAWLLAASLVFSPLTSLRVPGFDHLSYCDALFVIAVVTGVGERFASRDLAYKNPVSVAILTYIFCALALSASYIINLSRPVSIYWGQAHGLGYDENFFVMLLNAAIVPLAIFAVRVRSLAEFRFIILAWLAGALYGALFAIAYCNDFISHFDWYWVHVGRAAGLAHQPNALGINTVLALPGLLLFWCAARTWPTKILILMGVVVVWQAANYSGSRTALGALVIAIIVFMVMRSHDRARGFLVGGGALIAALLLRKVIVAFSSDLAVTSALGRLILGTDTAQSDGTRSALNSFAYQQWINNPFFGAGYGMRNVSHNVYLQTLDVAGIVGFLGYMCALGMPLVILLLNRTHEYARNEVAMIFSAAIAVLATGWVQPSISDYNLSVVFGLALYLALNPHFLPGQSGTRDGARALRI